MVCFQNNHVQLDHDLASAALCHIVDEKDVGGLTIRAIANETDACVGEHTCTEHSWSQINTVLLDAMLMHQYIAFILLVLSINIVI